MCCPRLNKKEQKSVKWGGPSPPLATPLVKTQSNKRGSISRAKMEDTSELNTLFPLASRLLYYR